MLKRCLQDVKWVLGTYRTVLLSFFLPALLLEAAYIVQCVYPFGGNDVLIIDLYHQYAPFLLELRDKILSFSSMLYTWTGGLGTNFLPLFAYYLASPLNILIAFFPENSLSEAVLFLILLKVGLSGACFSWYLKGVHKRDDLAVVAFSLLYALSGYVLAYSWCIMWLDALYLLPVVVLGLVYLIRDGRGILFCLSLALVIFSNFYTAIFVCIFILLYFPVCLLQYHGFKKPAVLLKKTILFGGYALLAAGLTAVIMLPVFHSLKLTSAAGESLPRGFTQYFDLFDYAARHFALASPSIRDGMANIYSGMAVLILLPFYFMSPGISHRIKLLNAALLLVLIVSLNTRLLDFIWHGFHFPNQLPFRNSFVYVFLVLSMAYPAYMGLGNFKKRHIGAVCAAVMFLIVLSQKLGIENVDALTAYGCLAVVTGYAAVLTLKKPVCSKAAAAGLAFLLMVIAEMGFNTVMVIQKIDEDESYGSRYGYSSGETVREIRTCIADIAREENSFYRMEVYPPKTTNDPFLYGYRGVSVFASTYPEKPVHLFERLGYHSNGINSFKYEGSTIILDSLFSVKYLIRRERDVEYVLRQLVSKTDRTSLYMNPYALSPGYTADESIRNWKGYGSNPFRIQNSLMKTLTGFDNILDTLHIEGGESRNMDLNGSGSGYYSYNRKNTDRESVASLNISVVEDREVYLYTDVRTGSIKNGHVEVNGEKMDYNAYRSTMVDLGYLKAGTPVELNLVFDEEGPESGSFHVYACSVDTAIFKQAISDLKDRQITIKSHSASRLSGTVNVREDSVMVMAIPYDTGWNVRVDGMEVETFALADCLLCFNISKGQHLINMDFVPDRFLTGLCITFLSLVILIVSWLRSIRRSTSPPIRHHIT